MRAGFVQGTHEAKKSRSGPVGKNHIDVMLINV